MLMHPPGIGNVVRGRGLPGQDLVSSKLFIGGLSYDTTDASLARYFAQYGEVAAAIVLRDPVTSHSRGFGFVTFRNEESAKRVLAHSRNHVVDGRKVEAKIAVPRNQTPPRNMNINQMLQTQNSLNTLSSVGSMASNYSYGLGGMNNINGLGNMNSLNMNMNNGLGIGDPYLNSMNNMNGMPYDMPLYNNNMNMNNDLYSNVPNFQGRDNMLPGAGVGGGPGGLRSGIGYDDGLQAGDRPINTRTARASPTTRFDERLNSVKSIQSSAGSINNNEEVQGLGGPANTGLRRPTYPQLNTLVPTPIKLRKFSMPPSQLEALGQTGIDGIDSLSQSFSGLNVRPNFEAAKLYALDLAPTTSAEALSQFFANFGKVVTTRLIRGSEGLDEKGAGYVIFEDPSSVEKVMQYEKSNGHLKIEGVQVQLKPATDIAEASKSGFMGRGLSRANTLPLDSDDLGFSSQDIHDKTEGRFPMMRAQSLSQGMLLHGDYDNDNTDFAKIPTANLLRDDKMRSLSFTAAAMNPHPLQRMQSDGGRRSSSFIPPERFEPGLLNQIHTNSGSPVLDQNLDSINEQ